MDANDSNQDEGSSRPVIVEEELSREIVGAFYEVYTSLDFGFLESIYRRALVIALRRRGLRVEREFRIEVYFDGELVGVHRADMLVEKCRRKRGDSGNSNNS